MREERDYKKHQVPWKHANPPRGQVLRMTSYGPLYRMRRQRAQGSSAQQARAPISKQNTNSKTGQCASYTFSPCLPFFDGH